MNTVKTTRRAFLKAGSAVSGGLVLSTTLLGATACSSSSAPTYRTAKPNGGKNSDNSAQINAWLHITPDNQLIFYLDKSEMGQGITTGLPVLIAEELEIDPSQLQLRMAPVDDVYKNELLGMQATGGSTSVRSGWTLIRKMGASARELLMMAAAHQWGVDKSELRAADGFIYHQASNKSAPYGDFASTAATLPVPDVVSLKAKQDYKLIGKYNHRLDAEIKTNGKAQFGIDTVVANSRVAVVVRSPTFGGKVRKISAQKAKEVNGVNQIFEISAGVAIVADNYWLARKAAKLLTVDWDLDDAVTISSDDMLEQAWQIAQKTGKEVRSEGDISKAFKNAKKPITARYQLPYLAHATMEPMNCTAAVTEQGCDIWVATQAQGLVPGAVSAITGIAKENVRVHTTFLGGGFGRRVMLDFVLEAVEISQRIKQPVKVVWSREDDMQHDFYRPMAVHKLQAVVGAEGGVNAWEHRIVSSSIEGESTTAFGSAFVPSWVPGAVRDPVLSSVRYLQESLTVSTTAVEGAEEIPYSIENLSVQYSHFNPGIPVGYWRSVGHSHNAFAVESFIDELAYAARQDPFAYRRKLLAQMPRHKEVLELAAQKANWGKTATNIYQGIAVHKSFGSYVAQVAEISVTDSGKLQVHKVICVIDCGQVINPDIVKTQMESGIIFGLTAAMYGSIEIDKGRVKQSNFDDYPALRMNESPNIEVYIIDSDEAPGGVGEPATPPIAPAVTNAIFAATGKRVRHLPLQAQNLRQI